MRTVIFKCVLVICLVLVTLVMMGFGCTLYKPWNVEASETRTVMFKPVSTHYAGQMAVCWSGRIYYVSQETGDDGIHSMTSDGEDVRFEFSVPKITRLIAREDAFYYVGQYDIEEKNHQLFAVFMKPHGAAPAQQLPTVDEYAKSVYDAYIAQDGTLAMIEMHNIGTSVPPVDILEFTNFSPGAVDDWNMYYFDEGDQYRFNVYIDETSSFVFSTSINGSNNSMYNSTLIDLAIGAQVMSSIKSDYKNYVKLLYVKDNTLVFGEYDNLVLMDRYTREKYEIINVNGMKEDMWVDYVFESDSGFLAIVKQENRKNDRLYYINTETEKTQELMKLSDKVLIDAGEGKVLFAQGNKIRCQQVSENGMGDMLFEIKMPSRVAGNNVFEIAGEWLFVHRHMNNREWDTNRLLYKVNLKTQEVVDVRG